MREKYDSLLGVLREDDGPSTGQAASTRYTIKAAITDSRAIVAGDIGIDVITPVSKATMVTLTVNAGVFQIGDSAMFCQSGVGKIRFAAGANVTINTPLDSSAQHDYVTVIRMGTNGANEVFNTVNCV